MPKTPQYRQLFHGQHGYGLVLLAVTVAFAYQCAVPDSGPARAGAILVQCTTLLFAVWASKEQHLLARLAEGLVVALAVASVALGIFGEIPVLAERVANLLLVALAPVFVFIGLARSVRSEGRVTIADLSAVLSIYLLIGLLFSFSFGVVNRLSDGGFFGGGVEGNSANYVYFSFSTLTTTGYGDYVARTDLGHTLAVLEALIGQVYLVTIVALIVSNLRARREPAGTPPS
jgi:hypothetical protein